jgi:hypothetical protein
MNGTIFAMRGFSFDRMKPQMERNWIVSINGRQLRDFLRVCRPSYQIETSRRS